MLKFCGGFLVLKCKVYAPRSNTHALLQSVPITVLPQSLLIPTMNQNLFA